MSIALTIISEAGKFSNGTHYESLLTPVAELIAERGKFVVHSNRAVETGSGQLFYEVFKL